MSKEVLGTDVNGRVDYSLPTPSDLSCYDIPLTANTVDSVTTPPNFNRAYFTFKVGTDVWVTYNGGDPIVPVAKGPSSQELNPAVRQLDIDGGQTLKFISDVASHVNIRWDLGA